MLQDFPVLIVAENTVLMQLILALGTFIKVMEIINQQLLNVKLADLFDYNLLLVSLFFNRIVTNLCELTRCLH